MRFGCRQSYNALWSLVYVSTCRDACSELRGHIDTLQAEVTVLRGQQAEIPTLLMAAEEAAGRAVLLEQTLDEVRPQLLTLRKDLHTARAELEQEQAGKARLQSSLQTALHTVLLREREADMLQTTASGILRESGSGASNLSSSSSSPVPEQAEQRSGSGPGASSVAVQI
jgi:chromosome segregation ATPase